MSLPIVKGKVAGEQIIQTDEPLPLPQAIER
ncbi:MAG: hypothetical protein KEFWMYNX_001579 [Candidatus Fervidibacter sp.]|mgnify:CR=1 FL=1|jgi:hypothetical protein